MPRLNFDRLAKAKLRLGDVALDPSLWPDVMEDICTATGSTGAALLQTDNRGPGVPMTPAVTDLFKAYFATNLHLTDIRAARGVPLILGGKPALCDQDLFRSESEMLSDPLYSTLTDHGFRWFSAISFRAGPALWVVSMQRTIREGMYDENEMKAIASLSQSLTDAATLSHTVGRQSVLGALSAFDLIKEAAISMTSAGKVREINASAKAMFDADFRVRNGQLYLRDQDTSDAIEELLAQSDIGPSDNCERIFFAKRCARRPLSIKAIPVHGAARSPFLGARLILTFRDLEILRRPAPEILAKAFSLTEAEAKVAAMIASGASPEQISDEFQVSRETVRNQLKVVFAKTGTHRQNELAALLRQIQD